jgi:O-antigen/teichoic acid export membrane protein
LVAAGPLILSLYGRQYVAAHATLLTLLAGLGFNYTLFWNRPLLLSLGLPAFPLWATLLAGMIKLGLAFALVPRFGVAMEAALLSLYYVLSVGMIVWRGMIELRQRERV